jgi:hypothetical protein
MRTSFLAYTFLAVAPRVLSAPLFGFGGDDDKAASTTSPVSNATVDSDLTRPAQFARLAYCSAGAVQALNCGGPCTDLGGNIQVTQIGGGAFSHCTVLLLLTVRCRQRGNPHVYAATTFPSTTQLIAFQTSSPRMLIRIKLSFPIRAQILRTCMIPYRFPYEVTEIIC